MFWSKPIFINLSDTKETHGFLMILRGIEVNQQNQVYFFPILPFCKGFLVFSGGIKWEYWPLSFSNIRSEIWLLFRAATGGVLKKDILKIFTKFSQNHLCQSLLFNKAGDLKLAIFLKNEHSGIGVSLWTLRNF